MKYIVTVRDAAGARTYPAIGSLAALMDAAYTAGALGFTAVRLP